MKNTNIIELGMATCLVAAFISVAGAYPVIDDTPTRVQTTLRVPLKEVGTLKPKAVGQIGSSRWTVDCATIDREHADWRAIRDYVAPLGIGRVRFQAGWARCEKEAGKYDFGWLDQVIYDAKSLGIDAWLEFSYGNPAYKGGGGRELSGGFPTSEEALGAWYRWVETVVTRYKGVVKDFCIWNEPDLSRKNDPAFVVPFAVKTAEIIRRIEPNAHIDAFALCTANRRFVEPLVKELARIGKPNLIDAVAYHHYSPNPDRGYETIESCKKIIAKYTPGMKMKEGEAGTLSEWNRTGALSGLHWTELSQSKYVLRRSLGDLGHGDDTSVFHLCDLDYRYSNFMDGLVRYGLLKTAGQAKGYRVLKVKMAYYAVQNAVSVFNDSLVCRDYSTTSTAADDKVYVCDWVDRSTGVPVVLFWDKSGQPSDGNVVRDVELTVKGPALSEPVWVDVLTGTAYEIPSNRIVRASGSTTYKVPCYDSPTFVAERKSLDLEESFFVRAGCPVIDTSAPLSMRPLDTSLIYGPVDTAGRAFSATEAELRAMYGEGRKVVAKDGRYDLMRPGALDMGTVPTHYIVFHVWSRQAQSATFCWRNDYFGKLAVNGKVHEASVNGPVKKWGTRPIELKEGENEIVISSSPGSSGDWFVDAGIIDDMGEFKVR